MAGKVHVMLQKHHGDEEMRRRQSEGMGAGDMIIETGLRVARFDFPEPPHTDPDIPFVV